MSIEDDEDYDDDYEVGYGKPPKHSQFKPGQSGNPGGRPKGSKSVHAVVQAICEEVVTVTENGQKKTMTKLEVATASLFSKASKGDVGAIKLLMSLKAEADTMGNAGGGAALAPEDYEVLLKEVDWLAFVQKEHAEVDHDGTE